MSNKKDLDSAISQIEKAFGKGSIMRLGQKENLIIYYIKLSAI